MILLEKSETGKQGNSTTGKGPCFRGSRGGVQVHITKRPLEVEELQIQLTTVDACFSDSSGFILRDKAQKYTSPSENSQALTGPR